jgi:hypothetical protein
MEWLLKTPVNVRFYRAVMSLITTSHETVNTQIRVCHFGHNHALNKELTELKTVMGWQKLKMSEISVVI